MRALLAGVFCLVLAGCEGLPEPDGGALGLINLGVAFNTSLVKVLRN